MGIFSQKFENPKPRFPEGKIPEPEKTRSQKPDLDPDPEMSTPNPPRPRLLLPDYITTYGLYDLHELYGYGSSNDLVDKKTFHINHICDLYGHLELCGVVSSNNEKDQ